MLYCLQWCVLVLYGLLLAAVAASADTFDKRLPGIATAGGTQVNHRMLITGTPSVPRTGA